MHMLLEQRRFTDANAVVVYVTGHGITGKDKSHLIVLRNTDPENPVSGQPPVSLRATPYRRENSGGTARDVVLTLVRLRPPVSLTPGAGHPRGRSLCARARGSVSSARPRFPGRYHLAG